MGRPVPIKQLLMPLDTVRRARSIGQFLDEESEPVRQFYIGIA